MRDAKPFSWWVQLRLRNPSQYYSLTSQDEMISDTHRLGKAFWDTDKGANHHAA